jgi:twitching motility protein PilT
MSNRSSQTEGNTPCPQAMALLDALLSECVRQDASDVHLSPDLPPYLRVEGQLEPQASHSSLSAAQIGAIADALTAEADRTSLEKTGSLDGAFSGPDNTRYRFNVFRRCGALSIAIRRLEDRFRGLAELGLPETLYHLCDLSDGLVIVAGPTGSGKSTTLATLLDRINRTRRCHIVTIEDPIEYVHRPLMSLVNQRQIGTDASTFNDALVASLRQDPDVVLVGEIRDLNTIRTAITAAETGHLVFTTVHAGDCAGTIERLVSVFPADEQDGVRRQLALVLRAIVAQHLLVADGTRYRSEIADGRIASQANREMPRRRVVTSEILMINSAVANLIATGKSNQVYSAMESGGTQGMQTLEQNLARLWVSGQISETAAVALSRSPGLLRERAARIRQRPLAAPQAAGGRR